MRRLYMQNTSLLMAVVAVYFPGNLMQPISKF